MNPNRAHKLGYDSGHSGDSRMRALAEIVDVDTLRCFPELVRQLGGDPNALLQRARIDPALISNPGAVIEYRALLHLMQHAATELSCPDFGLRLASLQGGNKTIGPIGVVMKNSKTLGQAIGYCARHIHAYSIATRVRFEPDRAHHQLTVRLEILLEQMPDKRQAVEHALMLASLNIRELTGGAARVGKVLFSHEPLTSIENYRRFFGCDVSFEEPSDGLMLTENDLLCPVIDADSRVYEMATSFIEARYPETDAPIHARVRRLILQHLGSKDCTSERIAAEFCLHPRTLQRRLRAEGTSFEDIKDEIRRNAALRYIQNGKLPLKCVAEKLGYAEPSVLTRSCYRWFSATPQQLRMGRKSEVAAMRGIKLISGGSQELHDQ